MVIILSHGLQNYILKIHFKLEQIDTLNYAI